MVVYNPVKLWRRITSPADGLASVCARASVGKRITQGPLYSISYLINIDKKTITQHNKNDNTFVCALKSQYNIEILTGCNLLLSAIPPDNDVSSWQKIWQYTFPFIFCNIPFGLRYKTIPDCILYNRYRKTSCISRTKFQNLTVSRLVLQLHFTQSLEARC